MAGYLYGVKKDIQNAVKGAKTAKDVVERIENLGYIPVDCSGESGYLNVRVPFPNGYVRVYKNERKELVIQVFEEVVMKYSGIPTFNPSGVNSGGLFDRMLG